MFTFVEIEIVLHKLFCGLNTRSLLSFHCNIVLLWSFFQCTKSTTDKNKQIVYFSQATPC